MNIREENEKSLKEQGIEMLFDFPKKDELRIKGPDGRIWRPAINKIEELAAVFDIAPSIEIQFEGTGKYIFVPDENSDDLIAELEKGGCNE